MFGRHPNVDATVNVQALLNALQGALGRKVTLFATASLPDVDAGYNESDGEVLPLIAAVAKHECVGYEMDVVFGGRFLTAMDRAEIDRLLDVAVASGRAWFSCAPAPFTSTLDPRTAVMTLLSSMHAGVKQLTSETRDEFVRLFLPSGGRAS